MAKRRMTQPFKQHSISPQLGRLRTHLQVQFMAPLRYFFLLFSEVVQILQSPLQLWKLDKWKKMPQTKCQLQLVVVQFYKYGTGAKPPANLFCHLRSLPRPGWRLFGHELQHTQGKLTASHLGARWSRVFFVGRRVTLVCTHTSCMACITTCCTDSSMLIIFWMYSCFSSQFTAQPRMSCSMRPSSAASLCSPVRSDGKGAECCRWTGIGWNDPEQANVTV